MPWLNFFLNFWPRVKLKGSKRSFVAFLVCVILGADQVQKLFVPNCPNLFQIKQIMLAKENCGQIQPSVCVSFRGLFSYCGIVWPFLAFHGNMYIFFMATFYWTLHRMVIQIWILWDRKIVPLFHQYIDSDRFCFSMNLPFW